MNFFLNRSTLIMLTTALALTLLCVSPEMREYRLTSIIAMGMHVGDTLLHEMGHTIFNWLFGQPAIPMIFTVFGADQAGGMSMTFGEPQLIVRLMALGALGYFCYWLRENGSALFLPMIALTFIIAALGFTGYGPLIVLYMGHGSSILMGGFFLYRAIIYLDARSDFERWLNAFFGFYLIGFNLHFAYELAFDASKRAEYSSLSIFGAGHHDFMAMTEELSWLTVGGIAYFTLFYCAAVIIGAFLLSYYKRHDYEYPLGTA